MRFAARKLRVVSALAGYGRGEPSLQGPARLRSARLRIAIMQTAKAFTLTAHGAEIPAIGFGTMELPHRPAELVAAALGCGYRHIDTARKYGTEQFVGEGIRASRLPRAELFVTTKVTEENAREADFMRSAETSLKTLGLDYVDLLLVHWPQPKVPFQETLGALAKAKRLCMTRHIGVSNFTLAMLDEAVRICPEPLVTNQVEYHAYLPQDKMLAALKRNGMILTAYCPVARGQLLGDPTVGEIARAHGKTPAQICLRWLIQQPGVAAVPRALEEKHIAENIDVFDFALTEDEMRRLFALRRRQLRIADPPERAPKWDVETV
jgi:diketogulonate reductase-like aldo/keto reductase